ncbi:universal stress protein [Natronobeatus ordinarius]|uniref:universal stress protein n=1 Tax=Natronobeatus ordinarius TaxID=2963433 RepID=UPI0020CF480C|nr:universal stress protein [Natronobeatus ordinarius]
MAVLVAYDGSSPARNAVEHAVSEHADDELILLRVIEAADGSTGAGIELVKERLKERRDESEAAVSEDVDDFLDSTPVEFRIETAVGNPAREIVAFAEAHDVDQIVVGNHGRAGVSRVLLGSVAEEVVRRAPVPVTVVR